MFNLKDLFTYGEVKRSFLSLKRKKRYKSYDSQSNKDRFHDQKEQNALGKFIDVHKHDSAYELFSSKTFSTYQLAPYQGITILKKNGKPRPLLVPTPLDRLVFLALLPRIRSILTPSLRKFSALGVGTNTDDRRVVRTICRRIQKNISDEELFWVLTLDFQDFFSSIDRKILFRRLKPFFFKNGAGNIFPLVKASIDNPINCGKSFAETFKHLHLESHGIPQGLAYSPLLASFFGLDIDRVIAKKRKHIVRYRYLDDVLVLSQDRENLVDVYKDLRKISKSLGLRLHRLGTKTKIKYVGRKGSHVDFLGIKISKTRLEIPTEAISRFEDVISKELFTRGNIKKFSKEKIKEAYKAYVKGWSQYYKAICTEHFDEIRSDLNEKTKFALTRKDWGKRLYGGNEDFFQLPL